MNSQKKSRISARITKNNSDHICQCDLFSNIEIIENIEVVKSVIIVHKILFPFIICLNQACDLESDYKSDEDKDSRLLHIAIAPVFNFDQFLSGSHWGEIFKNSDLLKRDSTKAELIMKNEIPRYHYLKFEDPKFPELIIDFKHFFTIERTFLYNNLEKRYCSIDDLFREKISQRFSNFISRIGLPE